MLQEKRLTCYMEKGKLCGYSDLVWCAQPTGFFFKIGNETCLEEQNISRLLCFHFLPAKHDSFYTPSFNSWLSFCDEITNLFSHLLSDNNVT